MRACPACGEWIGNASKRCRHCGHGGARTRPDGYTHIYSPGHPMANGDGYALEHRWLMHEMAIPVPPGHHVHHVNGVRNDNRWSNLEVIEGSLHHRQHIAAAGFVTNQYGTFPLRS